MLPEVNLLPQQERQGQGLYYIFLVSLLIVIIIFGVFGWMYYQTKRDLSMEENKYTNLELQKSGLEQKLKKQDAGESHFHKDAIAFAESYAIPTAHFINELFERLPEHAYISEYRYTFEHVEIQLQFETLHDTSYYMDQLNQMDKISAAEIDHINTFRFEEIQEDEEIQEVFNYEEIPRYDVLYKLDLDLKMMKKGGEKDE